MSKIYVSPGFIQSEKRFVAEVTDPEKTYLLPEYVTGLLLSRNINLEFRGISAAQSASAVRKFSSSSFSARGGFGPWSASVSSSRSRSSYERTYKMESSSDGLRISIPGAQIIGYYTQVTPQFPVPKNTDSA